MMEEIAPETTMCQSGAGTGRGERIFTVFLTVACAALATVVVLLVHKNHRLEEALAQANAALRPAALEVGEILDDIRLIDEAGGLVSLEFGDGQPHTLLLLFSHSCNACERTFPLWTEAVPPVDSEQLRILAVNLSRDLDPAPDSMDGLPFPIHSPAGDDTSLRKVERIPTTLLLDEYGVAEGVWTGTLPPSKQQELRETLAALSATGG